MRAALGCLGTLTYADVPEGDGKWTAQIWANDPNHGNESLKDFCYWPKNPPCLAGKRELMLVLHGCEQTALGDVIPDIRDDGFNWSATAEKYGAVIVAPNATGNAAGHHCWEHYGASHTRTSGHVGVLPRPWHRGLGPSIRQKKYRTTHHLGFWTEARDGGPQRLRDKGYFVKFERLTVYAIGPLRL